MAEPDRDPIDGSDPRLFQIGDVVERPLAERPQHDTVEAIIDWLAGPAQHVPLLVNEFDEFAWRMLAAGFPLLRATLQLRTLHPQYLGATFVWWRTTGQTVVRLVTHEVQDLFGTKIIRCVACWWPAKRCGAGSMSPMMRSISRSCMISRPRALPTILPCRCTVRSAPTTW